MSGVRDGWLCGEQSERAAVRVDPYRRRCRRWPISRLAAAREDLDDDHASAAARTGARLHAWLVWCGGVLLLKLNDAGQSTEQLAGAGDVGGTIAVGEEAIVADPVEALGQHVHQEAADELMRGERHRLPAVGAVGAVDAVVLPPEGDGIGVGGDQSAVGDGDAMGVAREIAQDLLARRTAPWCRPPLRQEKSWKGEWKCNLKPFEVTQRVRHPPGRGAARQPEASLAWAAVTSLVKRRQRKLKLCVSLEIMYQLRPSAWVARGQYRHDRYRRGRVDVVSEKFSKSRRRGWSWYAGDWAITGSFGRMHTMTKRQGKSGTIDIKAVLAEDEEFLRALVRMALQEVLEAEMTEALGAEKGERASGRQGYRSGYYGRTLITRVGKLELRVPQDRTGRFSTELFERYQRSERALVAALAEIYVQGVSTRKVKAITEELCGHSFSASSISAMNQRLDASLAQFAGRPLAEAFPYLILDARYERVREAGVIVSQAVLIAIGIDWDGRRQVLAVELA